MKNKNWIGPFTLILALTASGSQAATRTVTSNGDTGNGSLRTVIANASSGDDIIFSIAGPIKLSSDPLTISKSIQITGPAAGITIERSDTAASFRVFRVVGAGVLNMRKVTVSNGAGGGIYSEGLLAFEDCTFADNYADSSGGAIHIASGGASLKNCLVVNNSSQRTGGGIYSNGSGTVTFDRCNFRYNTATMSGGGIYDIGGKLTLKNCTVDNNNAAEGGGIFTHESVTLLNCTISGNSAFAGGGVYSVRATRAINCTIIRNSATLIGGGGVGGGILGFERFGGVFLKNTILVANTAPDAAGADGVGIRSEGHNLFGLLKDPPQPGPGDRFNVSESEVRLGALADNGGATQTHELLPGSAAIDAGVADATLATDQRGQPRNLDGNGDGTAQPDVGAFEARPFYVGAVTWEMWNEIPGVAVQALKDDTRFQANTPSETRYIAGFETPANAGDNFGARLSGYIIPQETADYVFFLSADDRAELYLSSDESPANMKLIASEPEWNAPRQWTTTERRNPANPENRSDKFQGSQWPGGAGPIRLERGKYYYASILHKEATGDDYAAITMKKASDPDPANGSPALRGSRIGGFVNPDAAAPLIVHQPPSLSVEWTGSPPVFSVGALQGALPLSYQWLVNGNPIPGETSPTLTIHELSLGHIGSAYQVVVTNSKGSTRSSPASIWIRGSLFIEAEDFNFNGGNYLEESIGTTGAYPGGSYLGKGATADIDYHNAGEPDPADNYRTGETPNVGIIAAPNTNRGEFDVASAWKVGWNGAGDWFNYTRYFPPDHYLVFATISSGGRGNAVQLDEVTAGSNTANQTTSKLGVFRADASGDYNRFNLVPLTDDSGNPVSVSLSGVRTLRAVILPDSDQDIDYLMLVRNSVPTPVITRVTEDTGSSPLDAVTRDHQLSLIGTARPGTTIRLTDDEEPLSGTATADAGGNWQFETTLADGIHTFRATAEHSQVPRSAPSAPFVVTVDTVPPVVSIGAPFVSATGSIGFQITHPGARISEISKVKFNVTGTIGPFTAGIDYTIDQMLYLYLHHVKGVGAVGISLGEGFVTDTAGNLSGAVGPSQTIAVDSRIPPFITWTVPDDLTDKTALGNAHLNAAATDLGAPVDGTYRYNPPAGTVLSYGPHLLSVIFTPSDSAKYKPVTKLVRVMVRAAIADQKMIVVGWGNNLFGQTDIPTGFSDVVAIAAGNDHSLALRLDGTVVGWGWNEYGQTTIPPGLSDVVAIAAGFDNSLALRSNGTVVGWGNNTDGQTTIPPGLSDVVAIAARRGQSLALKTDGIVVSWGRHDVGQTALPPDLKDVVAIAAGVDHSLALKSDGTVVEWGSPTGVPADWTDVIAIAAGIKHSLALKSDGTVVGWGRQTGVPADLTDVVAIGVGGSSLALKSDGTVVAWGEQTNIPADLTDVIAISAGEEHYLALVRSAPSNPFGSALKLDGVNDYLAISHFGNVFPARNVTIEFWQKVRDQKDQSTLRMDDPDGGVLLNVHAPYSNGNVYFDFASKRVQYTVPQTGGVADIVGRWTHFALVSSADQNRMTIYINGLEVERSDAAAVLTPQDVNLFIGAYNAGGGYFAGELDELRVWNSARTPEEIRANYQHPLMGSEPGLVLYLNFDEGSGTKAANKGSAGLNADAALFNDVEWTTSTVPMVPRLLTPIITWANPADIVYGTALGNVQLSAVAKVDDQTVAGTFSYSPISGTVLHAGDNQTLNVTFTPTDGATHTPASASVRINIKKAPLIIRAEDRTITQGDRLPITWTASGTGFVNGDTLLDLSAPPLLRTTATSSDFPGLYLITVGEAESLDYTITFDNGTLEIVRAILETPTITWATPADITYGTALGEGQFNAVAKVAGASIAGAWSYTPVAGTVLHAGDDQPLSVHFVPDDPANYTVASASTRINIQKAPLTIRAEDRSINQGDALPTTWTATYTGFVDGDTPAALSSQAVIGTTATSASPPGSYAITARGAESPDYTITFQSGSLTILEVIDEDITGPGDAVTAIGSGSPGDEGVAHAIDNDARFKYLNFQKLNAGLIVTPAKGPTIVMGFSLTSVDDALGRSPSSYILAGSQDGITFTEITRGGVTPFTGFFARKQFTFANTISYRVYQLIFPTLQGGATTDYMQIGEIELLGKIAAVAPRFNALTRNGNDTLTVIWTGGGTLQYAFTVDGPWINMSEATSPFTFDRPAASEMLFLRIR